MLNYFVYFYKIKNILMFVIYSEKQSTRLNYVLSFLFSDYAGTPFKHTTDIEFYKGAEGFKINYSNEGILQNEIFIIPHYLLFENDLNAHLVNVIDFEGTKALFPLSKKSDYPFDIFASVFYMLSRYEEYQPFIKDAHGRFKPADSLASQHGFLIKPVVNIWVNHFLKTLNKKFNLNLKYKNTYKFINTIDVDIAFSYKHKGFYRNFFGFLKSAGNMQFLAMKQRFQVLSNLKKDPFDTYDYILDLHQKHNLTTIFFIHVGDYTKYDKNIIHTSSKFRDLIRHLSDYAEIGIHPSYESSVKTEKVAEEIERLSDIVKKDIQKSRQHFLLLNFPQTYRVLLDNKIKEDYSLGFASDLGFRAGICTPFRFFDLDSNKCTSLIIRPFSIMEGTLKDYKNLNPDMALQSMSNQVNIIKDLKGEFISLWHNESLSDLERWVGWRTVYEKMIQEALS